MYPNKYSIVVYYKVIIVKYKYLIQLEINVYVRFKINIRFFPEKIIYSDNVESVTLPSYEGDMSILQNHIPNYLSLLDDRFIKIKTNKIIDNYLNTNIKNINLHIKYVQRSGFFNIPVINIIPNEGISPFENDSKSLSIEKKSEK